MGLNNIKMKKYLLITFNDFSLEPSHFGIGFRKGLFQIPNPYPDFNSFNVRCVRKK